MTDSRSGTRGGVDRRRFGKGVAATIAAAPFLARPALAQSAARIVVVGGGAGGATVAGHLKQADASLDVTLLEPNAAYTSCFFSNHYIGGLRDIAGLTHGYEGLAALGIKVVHSAATDIDTAKKAVRTADGGSFAYDRLVVAPGIDFKTDAIEGYGADAAADMPHAWRGRAQSELLHAKLAAMADGGVVVITAPHNPYRCPPGPYERACVIANYLKQAKPKSKIVILDAKMAYSKQPVFEEAFQRYYKDTIELHLTNDIDDQALARVDTKAGTVTTKAGLTVAAAVANVIPDQRAGLIAARAGLVDGDWCPVDFASMRSAKAADVYVIGDAARAAEMPKSAFTAHNHALMATASILAELGRGPKPNARYRNTCWSLLAPGDSVKIGADYAPGEIAGKPALVPADPFVSKPGETAAVRKQNYDDSIAWYDTLVADIFAKRGS